MKKTGKIFIIACFITIVLLISVYRKTEVKDDDPSDEIITDNLAEFKYGPGVKIQDIVYTGNPISIPYYVDSYSKEDFEIGFLLFLNGKPNKFLNSTNNDYLYTLRVSSYERIELDLVFEPAIENKDTNIEVTICAVFQPNYCSEYPNSSFGVYHKLSAPYPFNLHIENEVDLDKAKSNNIFSSKELPNYIKDEITNGTIDLSSLSIIISNDDIVDILSTDDITSEKDFTNINIYVFGGIDSTEYNLTLFADYEPIKIEGKNFILYQSNKESLSCLNTKIESKLLLNKVLKVIAIPIKQKQDDKYLSIFSSEPKKVVSNTD